MQKSGRGGVRCVIKDVKSGKGGVMTHNGEPYVLNFLNWLHQPAQYQVRRR